MTDEHLMRQWADAHSGFSADLDRGLLRLGRFLNRRFDRRQAIGKAYAQTACVAAQPTPAMSATARAALAGVMACVATTTLLMTVASLATSGVSAHAPAGTPIITHAIVA